jgi:hypothetical protein
MLRTSDRMIRLSKAKARKTSYALVVIAAAIVLTGLTGPGVSRGMSGINKARLIYANDYEDELPRAGGRDSTWGQSAWWSTPDRSTPYGGQSVDEDAARGGEPDDLGDCCDDGLYGPIDCYVDDGGILWVTCGDVIVDAYIVAPPYMLYPAALDVLAVSGRPTEAIKKKASRMGLSR